MAQCVCVCLNNVKTYIFINTCTWYSANNFDKKYLFDVFYNTEVCIRKLYAIGKIIQNLLNLLFYVDFYSTTKACSKKGLV